MARKQDNEPLFDGDPDVDDANHPILKANAGFQYEIDLIRKLRGEGFKCGDPAGADNAKADLEITFPKDRDITKFELKEKLSADFAQLNFDYDTSANKFYIDETKSSNQKEAAQTMIGIAKSFGILREANSHWGPSATNVPAKFTLGSGATVDNKKLAYALDIKRFPDKFLASVGSAAAEQVEKYYNSKNTYYIQIKGKGLYYMGKDIRNLGVPRFSTSCKNSSIRIRIKANSKSKGQYSFLMALKIAGLQASKFDLDKNTSFLIRP